MAKTAEDPVLAENTPELVTVMIPKDPTNKKDNSKFVGVNGKRYQIMRGVRVEVPKEVAEVLKLSNLAEEEADRFLEGLED